MCREPGDAVEARSQPRRKPQVLVGLVMVDGWPIANHVFQGDWRDAKTVPRSRNASGSSAWCSSATAGCDQHNVDLVREHGHGYIVVRNRVQRQGVGLYPKRNRPLDRMSGQHHGAQEADATQDLGSITTEFPASRI